MKKLTFSLQWKKLPTKIFVFWLKRYKLLFFFFFLMVAGWGSYEWYRNIVTYEWDADARKQYLDSTVKETAFQEEGFLKVLTRLDVIAEEHHQSTTTTRQLFVGPRPETGTRPQ